VERGAEALEVEVEALAYVEHHVLTHPADQQEERVEGDGADGGGGQHRRDHGDERAQLAATAREQRGDALVDAALDEPGHGQPCCHRDGDQDRRGHEGPVVRADEVAEERSAAAPQETGEAPGDLLDVLDVDTAPLVDQLVAGEVERRLWIDLVDLVRFDRGHAAPTSSASSESTAR
jgi:hypothetical protein